LALLPLSAFMIFASKIHLLEKFGVLIWSAALPR
jgi:hypothetical protein